MLMCCIECKLFHRFACILNYTLHRVVLRSMGVLCILLYISLFLVSPVVFPLFLFSGFEMALDLS